MSTADYDQPIVFRDDGVYVGGVKVPGVVFDELTVRTDQTPEHWLVDITLMTGVRPVWAAPESTVTTNSSSTTYRSRPKRSDE